MVKYTILTVAATLFCLAALINLIWNWSLLNLIGCALVVLATVWVFIGCARRGEPVARRLVHR